MGFLQAAPSGREVVRVREAGPQASNGTPSSAGGSPDHFVTTHVAHEHAHHEDQEQELDQQAARPLEDAMEDEENRRGRRAPPANCP